MGIERLEVPLDSLKKHFDPDNLGFETTDEVAPLEGLLGQERAESALELALGIDAPGFNLFISGPPGTGRHTAVRRHVERLAFAKPIPPDWGYVHNFQDPAQPIPISLPCGWVRVLAADMNELIETVRRDVPRAFESDDYRERMEEAMEGIQSRRQEMTAGMEQAAGQAGFVLRSTQVGLTPLPVVDGKPASQEVFAALPAPEQARLRQKADDLKDIINRTLTEIRRLSKEALEQARSVDREIVLFTVTPIVDELQEKYKEHPEVVAYLERVEKDLVEHLEMLKPKDAKTSGAPFQPPVDEDEAFTRYRVNDLVDNTTCTTAPTVVAHNPTYYNLFGRIDYQSRMGTLTTNHMMIKSGAIHEANGGYLILQARELLSNPLSWQTLKRTLHSGEIAIENMGEQFSALPSSTLRPKPLPLDAKIIIVGTPGVLYRLQAFDEEFRRYFKVTADFQTDMERTPENVAKYSAYVAEQCRDGGLRPFHKTAVARVIDYSSRVAAHQDKLTTRFMGISDIITEADYWAKSGGSDLVKAKHVDRAIEERHHRSNLREDRVLKLIEEGVIRISTDGEAVGQVNGLAVLSLGELSFGKPSRISARVSLGRGQVVNVERETKLSGRIHDKGFMILNGYVQGKYGYDKPLSLGASIGFEQNYSEVDGDSASSTELYALLSAISGLPINQGIAVTGSVDQNGDVQAIGGGTQKIEGFFEVCKAKGLTGKQGVMVPADNIQHLTLKDEVLHAVQDGRFHIYSISTIDEGIEVLTGTPAGERLEAGGYPEGTVHYLVEERLKEMAAAARAFSKGADRSSDNYGPTDSDQDDSEEDNHDEN